MSTIEIAVRYSKRLEGILERRFGAAGRGLHEKLTSVETKLPQDIVRSIRCVATMRNSAIHEDDFEIKDVEDFTKTCEQLIQRLESSQLSSRVVHSTVPKYEQTGYTKSYQTPRSNFGLVATLLLAGIGILFFYTIFVSPTTVRESRKAHESLPLALERTTPPPIVDKQANEAAQVEAPKQEPGATLPPKKTEETMSPKQKEDA